MNSETNIVISYLPKKLAKCKAMAAFVKRWERDKAHKALREENLNEWMTQRYLAIRAWRSLRSAQKIRASQHRRRRREKLKLMKMNSKGAKHYEHEQS